MTQSFIENPRNPVSIGTVASLGPGWTEHTWKAHFLLDATSSESLTVSHLEPVNRKMKDLDN